MPSSEKRKKRRSENQLRAELLEAHEWAVTACPEAFQLPDSEVVICEVSDSNKLIALGKFEGEGRTFVSFELLGGEAEVKLLFFFLLISFLSLLVKQSKGGPSWTPKGWGLASPTVSH